jgi:putative tricarboxylic transport membrane protein
LSRDLILAGGGLALAALYWAGAHALPTSMLSDGVGADGVPKGLAVALAILSILIALRRKPVEGGEFEPRAFGIALLGFAYVALAPLTGYFIAVTLLTGSAALYYGAPRRWSVAAFSLGTAVVLWATFGWMLGIPLPK